jgi:hypothetical protein
MPHGRRPKDNDTPDARLLEAFVGPRVIADWKAANAAREELRTKYNIAPAEIDAILNPPGEKSLLMQLRELTFATARHALIGRLREAVNDRAFSPRERNRLTSLANAIEAATLEEKELERRTAMLGLGRHGGMSIPDRHWWQKAPGTDAKLSRAGIIGERCVSLYRLLAQRIPAQRLQGRGQRIPKYNQAAMKYTALLVTGAYAAYGLGRLSSKDVAGHVQRRLPN